MEFIDITETNKDDYNTVVDHPLQSYEWGEFRKKTGVKVIRRGLVKNGKIAGGFTLTIHKIPFTNFNIGYLPKGILPDHQLLEEIHKIGKSENCVYIQLEPNIQTIPNFKFQISNFTLQPSFHPLFTKYTFVLDIDKQEEELLKNMHPKTRYNIRVAQKHNVIVEETNSNEAFEEYLRLTHETTSRQRFYAHTEDYHRKMWNTLKNSKFEYRNSKQIQNTNLKNSKRFEHFNLNDSDIVSDFEFRASDFNHLSAHLFTASYKPENTEKPVTLVSWILFTYHDTLYYPYGASSSEYRNVMASNLIMWEAIKFGKKLGLKKLDMWGALGPEPDSKDPWYGFHKFKQGYGASLTEFAGSYDLVINTKLYPLLKMADKIRWILLRLKK